ncbi:MAG: hypothetical protein LBC86_07940 [Oscillospiraceae bacterium]|jgi:hypothetical protein|nr:hypothetical protein [Oscillospiraceae bacterium]
MAKETKIIEVGPSELNSTIKFWASFGWDVISSNTIDTRQVHYVDGDVTEDIFGNVTQKINTRETGEKYISITFQRDKSMGNYDKLVALENKYVSISPILPGYEPSLPKKFSAILIILSIVGLAAGIFPGLIFIFISAIKFATYPNRYKKWEEEVKEYKKSQVQYEADINTKKSILAQAESLC